MENRECTDIIEVAEGPSICNPEEAVVERHASAVQQESAYGIKVWVQKPYKETLTATKHALNNEGLVVLSEINLRQLFKDKLGAEFRHYTVLAVCKPQVSYDELKIDIDLGLLIPFNVAVYEQHDGTVLEAIDPIAQLAVAGNLDLHRVAVRIKQMLQDVIDHVVIV